MAGRGHGGYGHMRFGVGLHASLEHVTAALACELGGQYLEAVDIHLLGLSGGLDRSGSPGRA